MRECPDYCPIFVFGAQCYANSTTIADCYVAGSHDGATDNTDDATASSDDDATEPDAFRQPNF